jgi:hypothetical protein
VVLGLSVGLAAAGLASCGANRAGWCDDGGGHCPDQARLDDRIYNVHCWSGVVDPGARSDRVEVVYHDGDEHDEVAWTVSSAGSATDVLVFDAGSRPAEGCGGTAYAYGPDLSLGEAEVVLAELAAPGAG